MLFDSLEQVWCLAHLKEPFNLSHLAPLLARIKNWYWRNEISKIYIVTSEAIVQKNLMVDASLVDMHFKIINDDFNEGKEG